MVGWGLLLLLLRFLLLLRLLLLILLLLLQVFASEAALSIYSAALLLRVMVQRHGRGALLPLGMSRRGVGKLLSLNTLEFFERQTGLLELVGLLLSSLLNLLVFCSCL